jgi:hypothetical protein
MPGPACDARHAPGARSGRWSAGCPEQLRHGVQVVGVGRLEEPLQHQGGTGRLHGGHGVPSAARPPVIPRRTARRGNASSHPFDRTGCWNVAPHFRVSNAALRRLPAPADTVNSSCCRPRPRRPGSGRPPGSRPPAASAPAGSGPSAGSTASADGPRTPGRGPPGPPAPGRVVSSSSTRRSASSRSTRRSCSSTIRASSASPSGRNTTMSSIRFRNSGRKPRWSSAMTWASVPLQSSPNAPGCTGSRCWTS